MLDNINSYHLFWLVTNLLLFLVLTFGIILLFNGIKKTKTLKTGAGPWIIFGFAIILPLTINEILDELDILIESNLYPDELYSTIFRTSPLLLLLSGMMLVIGIYKQFLVGERLSHDMLRKNIELEVQRRELSEFAHILGHEIRNELSLIQAIAESSQSDPNLSNSDYERMNRYISNIKNYINRSIELADAGLIVGDKRPVDSEDLVKGVLIDIDAQMVKIKTSNLPVLIADPDKLLQVFRNIIENAIIHGKAKSVRIEGIASEENFVIRFTNDGERIPPEIQRVLFKEELKSHKRGHGLGLIITKRIVEAHGWKIRFNSNNYAFELIIPHTAIKKEGET
ncbi:MAG: sensor histidine kinase [Candidatus Hodarchaeales archaeon]